MKKLLVLLVFAVAAFAQRGGAPPSHASQGPAPQGQQPHFSAPPTQQQPHFNQPQQPRFNQPQQQQPRFNQPAQQGWNRFGQPGMYRPPMRPPMRPPVIIQRPIVVRPYFTFGYYPWSTYYDWGFWPYYPWFYDNGVMMYREPQPCKKESLKDSNGVKHQILICVQSDGTTQVIDANAPK